MVTVPAAAGPAATSHAATTASDRRLLRVVPGPCLRLAAILVENDVLIGCLLWNWDCAGIASHAMSDFGLAGRMMPSTGGAGASAPASPVHSDSRE